MASSLVLDLDQNLSAIRKSAKTLNTELKLSTLQFKAASSGVDKFAKSMGVLGVTAKGALGGLLALSDIQFKLAAIAEVGKASYEAWKKFGSITKTVTFEEAIQGSTELSSNLEILEQTGNSVVDGLRQGFSVLFDNDNFNKFSSKAVKAYADIEQAAYRLGTVTVTGNEKSIDSISKGIKTMRDLQKATDDAVGSVELLNAQYDIASAGFGKAQDNKNVGKASVNLGQAGFGNLAGSTNAVVRALRALGDESSAADKRASQLFETTKVGLLTLDQLTPNVGGLAVQAKQLGIDFSEVLGALAGLTTQGVSADEASTRITSLLSDITAGSQEANLYLSKFRDEAGKPIQINATVLKSKGLSGVIADLQKATGGRPENIQKVFSNQTSVEAVQLFSSLGKKSLDEYSKQIKETDGTKLEDEAKGRSKTVTGAFEQAKVKSQKGVEDFGAGLAPSVVESISKTNEVTEAFTTGAAEGVGKLAGSLQGLQTKISAIGGFFASAFSAIAPLVLFAVIGKLAAGIPKLFSNIKKEGESIWDSIKRKAVESVLNIKEQIIKAAKEAIVEIRKIQQELDKTSFEKNFDEGAAKIPGYKPKKIEEPVDKRDQFTKDLEEGVAKKRAEDPLSADLDAGVAAKRKQYKDIGFSESDITDIETKKSAADKAKQVRAARVKPTERFSDFAGDAKKGIGDKFSSTKKGVGDFFSKQKDVFSKGGTSGLLNQKIGDDIKLKPPAAFTKVLESPFGKAAGGGIKALTSGIGVIAKGLLGLGVIGFAAGAGLAIAAGWVNTLGSFMNKSSNPNIKAMGEALGGLNKEILASSPLLAQLANELQGLDGITKSTGNSFFDFANEMGSNWNTSVRTITGGTTKVNQVFAEAAKAQDALNQKINLFKDKGVGSGKLSLEGTAAKAKLDKGQILNSGDEQALQKELSLEKELLDAQVAIAQQKVEAAQQGGSKDQIEQSKVALEAVKRDVETEKKLRENALKSTLGGNLIKNFNAIDTSIPLSVSISKQNQSAIISQINDVGTKAGEVFGKKLLDPKQFYDLFPQIGNALGSIETQVTLDPDSATELLNTLKGTINQAGGDFNKILASDPAVKKRYSELRTAITQTNESVITFQQTSDTAILSVLKQTGVARNGLTAKLNETLQKSLDTQIANINEELNDAATPLPRQSELKAKIAELQAQKLSTSLENASASVDEEFAARNKLIEQTSKLGDQFDSLAGNSLFSNSAASSGFKQLGQQVKNPNRQIDTEAAQAIAKANAKVGALESALASASGEQADNISKALQAAKDELPKELETIKTEATLKKVNVAAEQAALKIEAETQQRDNIIAANERVISSFSNLASTAGSLFKSSSVGATLGTVSAVAIASQNKPGAEYDKETRIIDARIAAAKKAATDIGNSTASDDIKKQASAIADRTRIEGELQKKSAAQSYALDLVNQKLTVFAAKVNETSDKIGKQADLFKDSLDRGQKQREVASENNKSITGLQQGLIGFLGQNNPAASIVGQRLDVKQAKEDEKIKLAQSRTEAKKDIIDLKVFDLQLQLEQQGYENAITQTALLGDLVRIGTGQKPELSQTSDIQKQLAGLPAALREGQQFTAARRGLTQQKLGDVFSNQDLTEQNIRREGAKTRLGILGQNRSPANFDLQAEALKDTKDLLRGSKSINYDSKPLSQDTEFKSMLNGLDDIKNGGKLRGLSSNASSFDSTLQDLQSKQALVRQGGGGSAPQISSNPNISININVSKEDAAKLGDVQQQIRTQVGKGLEQSTNAMSQELLKYARGV